MRAGRHLWWKVHVAHVGRCALALAPVLADSCFRVPVERLLGNEA